MFLFQRTFYALKIVFILSMSKMVLGKPEPYFPGIGDSVVMHPGQIINGQHNWNGYDVSFSNKFGSPEDNINEYENMDILRVLKALQYQWEQMENTRRNLKLLRLF